MKKTAQAPEIRRVEEALNILGSVLPNRCAVYIAAPITTGRHFYEFCRQHRLESAAQASDEMLTEQVVEPNRIRVRPVIGELRRRLTKPIIDPTKLHLSSWTQEDYRSFWRAVIETFVDEVVFLNGWEYSTGCIHEFLVACEQQVMMFTEHLTPLGLSDGMNLIRMAMDDLKRLGHDSPDHVYVLEHLRPIARDAGSL